jgi:CheY-like chemotaxis protein
MVVDDNVDVAESLASLIRFSGPTVEVVTRADAALRQAGAFAPDVMFIDIGLPGMDGYQLARALRGRPELEGMVLIACTGYGRDEDVRRSREAGFDQHWVKPFEAEALDKLWETLASRR